MLTTDKKFPHQLKCLFFKDKKKASTTSASFEKFRNNLLAETSLFQFYFERREFLATFFRGAVVFIKA